MSKILNIRYLALVILLALTALMYHPIFSNVVTMDEESNPLRPVVVGLTIVTTLLYFDFSFWTNSNFVKKFLIYLLVIELLGYVLSQMNITDWYSVDANNILLSFLFLLIGYGLGARSTNKQLVGIILLYSFFVAFSVYFQLMQHAGGFIITDRYIEYGKNTMGVMCAASCIALLTLALTTNNKVIKIVSWILYFFILFLDITIRARASYLVIFIISLISVIRTLKGRMTSNFIFLMIVGVFVLIALFLFIPGAFDSIGLYIWDSFTQHQDMDDLSSGRTELNDFALNIIGESPLWGNMQLKNDYYGFRVHNYLLRVLSSYGIIGALPLYLLYFSIIILVIKKIFKSRFTIQYLGYFVSVVPLIISLAEPTFPYSPGTGVIFSFVFLGYSIRKTEYERLS